jgi:hypothetical protein
MLKKSVRLKCEPIAAADQGSEPVFAAADAKFAFTITREFNGSSPAFVARVGWLTGSNRRRIRRKFKALDAAVRWCSVCTRVPRRQAAYHEVGHAVVAWLLGFSGVWIDMSDGTYRAITKFDLLPAMLTVADASSVGDGHAALARYLYEEVMVLAAGLVAEVKLAGYQTNYTEADTAGRPGVAWDAARLARVEAGLPICGHKDCEIPFDAERIAEVIKRAEGEVFDLLKANWSIVERVVNALCKQDRLTTADLDALIAGRRLRSKRKQAARSGEANAHTIAGNDGSNA